MTGKQLKNSILQLAIQGKLVPQDPNDEPASILLQRIRKEKEQLVKEGKLKKKDLISEPITDEEKPFEIPKSWEWCRLKEVFTMQAGKNINTSELSQEKNETHEYLCYGGNGVRGHIGKYNYEGVYPIIGRQGALCGCVNMANGKFQATEHAVVVTTYAKTNELWAYHFLIASNLNKYATATAQPGLSVANILETLIPLPPLSEQHRIVAKIEELMPLVEEYDKAEKELNTLNEELPEQLKKSILQLAIQGKLVPQDPNDEPASVLLQRIRKEKEQLMKEGKLKKKDLATTPITDEEKPFEIPKSWEWVRLKDVVYNNGQKTPDKVFSYIDIGSIDNKNQKLNDRENLIEAKNAPSRARKIVKYGDIVYSTVRPYLHNVAIIDRQFSADPIASTGFAVLSTILIYNKYLFYFLFSPQFDEYANDGDNAKGIAYPAINDDKLYKTCIPLPPLAEQHRIVAKIEELFGILQQ